MQKIIFSGNLIKDCSLKTTTKNTVICQFSVANDVGFGEHKKTNYFSCTLFGKRAEGKLPDFLRKGAKVIIEGEVSLNTFVKTDGEVMSMLDVFVHNVELMGNNKNNGSSTQSNQINSTDAYINDLPF